MEPSINDVRARLQRTSRNGLRARLAGLPTTDLGRRLFPQTLASGGLRTRTF